jgi:hypothetical protein
VKIDFMMREVRNLIALLFLCCCAFAQNQATRPANIALVSFTLDFPGSDPDHYSFRVPSQGAATYESTARLSPQSEDKDSYQQEFTISPAIRDKIFDLASRAGYFQKPIDSAKKHIASTGTKVLSYKDDQRTESQTYNYSSNPAVQELTGIFQNLSATMEFGRRLQYDYRYQKLALDEELKRMEEEAKSGSLVEVQALQPILDKIAADPSVINVVRARAQKLVAMAR